MQNILRRIDYALDAIERAQRQLLYGPCGAWATEVELNLALDFLLLAQNKEVPLIRHRELGENAEIVHRELRRE